MEEVIDKLTRRDTKERLLGVERLQTFLDHSQKGLSANEVLNLVDASMPLLRDNNHKVCKGILHALTSATTISGEHFKLHFNQLVPTIIERLGDNKQSVRDAGRRLLLAFMEVFMHSTLVGKISLILCILS
jgi:CLIP-associating protein 1/2